MLAGGIRWGEAAAGSQSSTCVPCQFPDHLLVPVNAFEFTYYMQPPDVVKQRLKNFGRIINPPETMDDGNYCPMVAGTHLLKLSR
jgi:hypothetical protein